MTAIAVRTAYTTFTDRLLTRIGLALVRYGSARAERAEQVIRRHRAELAAQRRREGYERDMLRITGPRR